MAIDIAKLQEDIYDILDSITNSPVIIQDQEGNKPAASYTAFQLKDWKQIGNATSEHYGGTSADFVVKTLWEVKLNILCVGPDAQQLAVELSQRCNRSTLQFQFEDVGLTFQYVDDIKHAPKLVNTGWEQRYYFNICFNVILEDIESLNYWEFLEITTIIKDVEDNTVISEQQIVDIVP